MRLVPLCFASCVLAASAPAQHIAITNANVVDVRAGVVLPRMTVEVRDGRITRISRFDSLAIPVGARVVDGRNAFLLPGLADLHAHLKRPEDLELFISYGVTTVQFLNAGDEELRWRDSIRLQRRVGPDIHACAGALSNLLSVSAAVSAVRDAQQRGFTCVKPYDRYTDSSFRAIIAESRQRGIRTTAHIPRMLTWQQALAARPDAIAHLEEFLYSPIDGAAAEDSLVRQLAERSIAVVTTLTNYDLIGRQVFELPTLERRPENGLFSAVDRRQWAMPLNRYTSRFSVGQGLSLRRLLSYQHQLLRRLDSAGVRILSGTDAGNNFVVPGISTHDELAQLVSAGLSPAHALRAATLSAAEFLGIADSSGSIDVGKRADLVLVYGNPLRDISNTHLIAGVMRSGVWYSSEDLRAKQDAIRSKFRAESVFVARAITAGPRRAVEEAQLRRYRPDPYALNELGYQRWYVEENMTAAGQAFRVNTLVNPASAIALGSYAQWLAAKGDSASARRWVARAVRAHPGDSEIQALARDLGVPPPAKR